MSMGFARKVSISYKATVSPMDNRRGPSDVGVMSPCQYSFPEYSFFFFVQGGRVIFKSDVGLSIGLIPHFIDCRAVNMEVKVLGLVEVIIIKVSAQTLRLWIHEGHSDQQELDEQEPDHNEDENKNEGYDHAFS